MLLTFISSSSHSLRRKMSSGVGRSLLLIEKSAVSAAYVRSYAVLEL
jgi:hypothetical protein